MGFFEYMVIGLLVLGLLPFCLALCNRFLFKTPDKVSESEQLPPVSILIPARNEENNIVRIVSSCLASERVEVEVIVLDDNSEDSTSFLVEDLGRNDDRVRIYRGQELPEGWSGKQFACHQLANLAKFDHFLFIDADLTIHPHCVARVLKESLANQSALLSGFPRQTLKSPVEKLLLPLIHFVLLSYLPFWRMRSSRSPSASAGCGQFFLTSRKAYESSGGHEMIASSAHDGIQLPRLYRRAGFKTDLCDITGLASVRMYHNAGEVWHGLIKNAHEGLASPGTILPMTVLLAAQVIPCPLLLVNLLIPQHPATVYLIALTCLINFANRLILSVPFKLPVVSVALHPLGVGVLLLIQWVALFKRVFGFSNTWKGRQLSSR